MLMELVVGVQALGDSSRTWQRGDKQGGAVVSHGNPRYHENAYRRNAFFVANQAVVTTTVGLATTYTGLVLSNPITSTKVLSIKTVSVMQSVLQATQIEAYGIATGYNASTNVTHTTPVTPQTASIGSGAVPVALADVAATLPTAPVYALFVENTGTATQNGPGFIYDLAGQIMLNPGAYICWVTPAQASVAGMWFSFSWDELPV